MGAGSNALGFGGGFARGFANALLLDTQRKREDARLGEERKFREFQVLQPTRLSHAEETGDWAGYQEWLTGYFPDLDKQFKKGGGSPFENLAPLLQAPTAGAKRMDTTQDQVDAIAAGTGEPPTLPSRTTVSPATPAPPPDPKSMFFGSAMPTPEQRAQRQAGIKAAEQTTISVALMDRARNVILPALKAVDPQATIYDALRVVGIETPQTRQATPPQPGTFGQAVQLRNAERAAKGLGAMTSDELQAYMVEWETQQGDAQRGAGVDREALSKALFDKAFVQLSQPERQVVIEEETKLLGKESQSRAEGTGQGRFNTPIDVKTAQDTGLPTGVTSAQVAGQNVPTMNQQEQLRAMVGLRADITRILGDGTTPGMLAVLPKESELGGKAPGAAWAIKRRTTHRTEAATLQANIDSIVGVLSRIRGLQVGTQTEQDATRAYNALVQLQAGLLDPLGGDTQESATARIKEALVGLDRVIQGLPKTPVPQPVKPAAAGAPAPTTPAKPGPATAQPAPAAGGSGLFTDKNGNIVDGNGNIVVPF